MNSNSNIPLTLLALCISQQLHANTDINSPTPSTTLDTITVTAQAKTGTALGQKISEMPAVTQLIREDEIAEQAIGSRTLGDVLAQLVPGLGLSSGSTSNYGTTMRGRPVQYLLNGVPLTGARDLSRQLNSIDPKQLERVEVLSGATSIYGSGATGGLINLVTKSAGLKYGLHGQSRIGVNSHKNFEEESLGYTVGQSLDYANDTLYGRLDVDYQTEGGSFDSYDKRISPDVNQTDQQDTETLSINANLGINLNDSQNINLAVTHYDNQQDTDYGPDYSPNIVAVLTGRTKPSLQAVEGAKLAEQPRTTKNSVSLNYHNDQILGSSLNITGYYRDEKGRFYPSAKIIPANRTLAYLMGAGITDADTLKALASSAVGVTQSEADIEVMGIRAAMQTEMQLADKPTLLSYGVDFEREKDEQTYYAQDVSTFLSSNGLIAKNNGITYFGGPDTTVDKLGTFINADVDLTDKWHASAGVRYQNIQAKTEAFTPIYEQMLAEFSNNPKVVKLTRGQTYTAGMVAKGETDHSKTLFNMGSSYQITPQQQVFANFSQGFTIADVQRALRDVSAGYVVNSDNVEPITVNSYDMGWQAKFENTQARLSAFYNSSDKNVQFTKDYTVEIADTDERVYGAEGSIDYRANDEWTLGSTLAYARGQYKDNNGDWKELDAVRVTPIKGTAYAQYNFATGSNLRLQMLAVGGTDKAYQEHKDQPKANVQPVVGYATVDLLGQVDLGQGRGKINYGVYNLLNKDYKSVYHQTTYGEMNRLNAAGRSYGVSYTINY